MVAVRWKLLKKQLTILFQQVGEVYNSRLNLKVLPEVNEALGAKIASDVDKFYGKPVQSWDRTDGLELIFEDGSWVLNRSSGTEPVVRCYAEAGSRSD